MITTDPTIPAARAPLDAFSSSARGLLADVLSRRPLCAFDFDGTLAPFAEEPEDARLPDATRALLRAIARALPCAVVSTRRHRDLVRLLGDTVPMIVGNHGMEPHLSLPSFIPLVQRARATLEVLVRAFPGASIEDKELSLTVHARHAADPRAVCTAVHDALRAPELTELSAIDGELAVNVVPTAAPQKAGAVRSLAAAIGANTILFVGDDDTDEVAFQMRAPPQMIGVRVNRPATTGAPTAARLCVPSQRHVDALLRLLIELA